MKGRRLWWPVIWSEFEVSGPNIAYFDEEDMANGIKAMFEALGLSASVAPPVRLSIFQTYLPDPT